MSGNGRAGFGLSAPLSLYLDTVSLPKGNVEGTRPTTCRAGRFGVPAIGGTMHLWP